jgi:hypothetical protein
MSVYAYVIGESDVALWGISSRERLIRQMAELDDAAMVGDLESLPDGARVLCVRADYLFESRILKSLAGRDDTLLRCASDGRLAAGCCSTDKLDQMLSALRFGAGEQDHETVFAVVEPASLAEYEERLRKAEEPLLLPVSERSRAVLEDQLYGRSYKGITDLVTKWFWPRPAKHAVRICARLGLTPNMVTLTGLVLVIYAGYAFYHGDYWLGLAAGWFMTFLDTVDGKLARVTIKSSRLGHVLDHGMDIVHPPFWYVLWGMSLSGPLIGFSLEALCWWTFAGYLGGRLIEGAFHGLGACSLFDWRPFDAYFRLITARRNPCLIILTAAMAVGSPEAGFLGVVLWTVATTLALLLRLLQAAGIRLASGPLGSWLADPALAAANHPRAFRTFSRTRGAYLMAGEEP